MARVTKTIDSTLLWALRIAGMMVLAVVALLVIILLVVVVRGPR